LPPLGGVFSEGIIPSSDPLGAKSKDEWGEETPHPLIHKEVCGSEGTIGGEENTCSKQKATR